MARYIAESVISQGTHHLLRPERVTKYWKNKVRAISKSKEVFRNDPPAVPYRYVIDANGSCWLVSMGDGRALPAIAPAGCTFIPMAGIKKEVVA